MRGVPVGRQVDAYILSLAALGLHLFREGRSIQSYLCQTHFLLSPTSKKREVRVKNMMNLAANLVMIYALDVANNTPAVSHVFAASLGATSSVP